MSTITTIVCLEARRDHRESTAGVQRYSHHAQKWQTEARNVFRQTRQLSTPPSETKTPRSGTSTKQQQPSSTAHLIVELPDRQNHGRNVRQASFPTVTKRSIRRSPRALLSTPAGHATDRRVARESCASLTPPVNHEITTPGASTLFPSEFENQVASSSRESGKTAYPPTTTTGASAVSTPQTGQLSAQGASLFPRW